MMFSAGAQRPIETRPDAAAWNFVANASQTLSGSVDLAKLLAGTLAG